MGLSLISQLAHVELTTPKPQESLEFWRDVIGLEETAREGQSVFLRGWGDRCVVWRRRVPVRGGLRVVWVMAALLAIGRPVGIFTVCSGTLSSIRRLLVWSHRSRIVRSATSRVAWRRVASIM
jgi:hypothetical protein